MAKEKNTKQTEKNTNMGREGEGNGSPLQPIEISVRGFYHKGRYYQAHRRDGKFYFAHEDPEVMKAARKYRIKR